MMSIFIKYHSYTYLSRRLPFHLSILTERGGVSCLALMCDIAGIFVPDPKTTTTELEPKTRNRVNKPFLPSENKKSRKKPKIKSNI